MEVSAKIVVKRLELQVEGTERITVDAAFQVGNVPIGFNGSTKFTIPVTEEIAEHIAILKVLVAEQIGEIVTKNEGDDE
jgi:hypothetical protein